LYRSTFHFTCTYLLCMQHWPCIQNFGSMYILPATETHRSKEGRNTYLTSIGWLRSFLPYTYTFRPLHPREETSWVLHPRHGNHSTGSLAPVKKKACRYHIIVLQCFLAVERVVAGRAALRSFLREETSCVGEGGRLHQTTWPPTFTLCSMDSLTPVVTLTASLL
jgi:hypothetical protein